MAIVSTSTPIVLTTDETFDESSIGRHLSEGKRFLLEWKKQKIESGTSIGTVGKEVTNNCDSNSNNEVSIGLSFLRTEESFPTKLLVEEKDQSKKSQPSADDGVINNKISYRSSRKKRKSIVFLSPVVASSSNSSSNNSKRWWKKEKSIRDSIPSNASGIVGVMGRRINMEQMCENNTSVYSMLRSWVEDDPCKDQNELTSIKTGRNNRKTISEYVTMKPVSETGSAKIDKISTTTTNNYISNSISRMKSAHGNTSLLLSSSPPLSPPFDLIKWLDTDPNLRTTIPYYPEKQMQEFPEHHRTKEAAKASRALAKKKLRSAGIFW